MIKKLVLFSLLIHFSTYKHYVNGRSDNIQSDYNVTVTVSKVVIANFTGRAILLETNATNPRFRVTLSAESYQENYVCSIDVFLGDFKVWSSGHFWQFYTTEKCVARLTRDGDLQLLSGEDHVGWQTGTSGQGIKRLQILANGNLVLVDEENNVKWQSFHFPTDTLLWGQSLNVGTRLTSFPVATNSTSLFYSFEIQRDKIALYLNSGKLRYSYWEFRPSSNRNLTYVRLASNGLLIFNDYNQKIAQIRTNQAGPPLRFLALGNRTGNFGLYYFSASTSTFEAAFQALTKHCDLPLACNPYGICTLSDACSCIRLVTRGDRFNGGCSEEIPQNFCGKNSKRVEMLELRGTSTVLRDERDMKTELSKDECSGLCLHDCKCVGVLHIEYLGECYLYREVRGVKQVEEKENGVSYMVKVLRADGDGEEGKSGGLKKWVFILVVVVDGLIIFLVLGGLGFYFLRRRRKTTTRETVDND